MASAGVQQLLAIAPANLPRIAGASVNWSVVLFTFAISLAASLLFGSVPAWQALRNDVQEGLKSASGRGFVGGGKARLRHALEYPAKQQSSFREDREIKRGRQ